MGRDRRGSFAIGSFGKSKEDSTVIDVKLVGLVNLGNSCFYNTILQSLSATIPLASIIANPPITSPSLLALCPPASENPSTLLSPLPITKALLATLSRLDPTQEEGKDKGKVYNPKALLRELSRKHSEYSSATQEDGHELLRHLIDGVMMEEVDLIKKQSTLPLIKMRASLSKRRLTIRASGTSERPTLQTQEAGKESGLVEEPQDIDADDEDEEEDESSEGPGETCGDSSEESSDSSDSDTSSEEEGKQERPKKRKAPKANKRPFIDAIFGGKLASVVICEECKNVSLTREDFMDLSLSLKEDDAKMRKRDRIRKSLQANFFSKRAVTETSKPSSTSTSSTRREPSSLSEAEASASPSNSEFESDDGNDDAAGSRARARRKSLDPTHLRERKPMWSATTTANGSGPSREASPMGRALSLISGNGRPKHRAKPKIPKPSREQLEYIKKVLADIPGPATTSLPSQLRWSRPPGTSADGDTTSSSASSFSSASHSLSHLKLAESMNTDLYQCLLQFTAVETLEGENSFACKNCWKLLHPEIVRMRREEKLRRREERRRRQNTIVPSIDINTAGTEKKKVDSGNYPQDLKTPAQHAIPASVLPPGTDNDLTPIASITDGPLEAATSNLSLSSSISSSANEGGSVEGQMADVEDSAGSVSDVASIFSTTDPLPSTTETLSPLTDTLPLTTENVEALSVDAVTEASTQLVTPSVTFSTVPDAASTSASLSRAPSGASLSTRLSGASLKTSTSSPSIRIAPPKQDRRILRRAHKRYLISAIDLPPVIVIHFKRFMQTSKGSLFGTAFSNLKKRDDDLSFPQELDLSPFLAPVEKPPGASQGRTASAHDLKVKAAAKIRELAPHPDARYSLYAVVVHIGNLGSGHYVAYVLSDRYTPLARKDEESTSSSPTPRRWF